VAVVTGQAARWIGAGRTDAGVHASGQVAHIDISWHHSLAALARALNATLPRDVVVRDLVAAPSGFHARHSAIGRAYRYTLWTGPTRSPLRRRTSFHVRGALDVDRMAEAGRAFVGRHDFAAFGRAMTIGGPTVRRVDRCTVFAEGRRVVIEIEANAFLRHQVRRTVGLLVAIGQGRLPVATAAALVSGAEEGPVPGRVPAQGLDLERVLYPPDDEIGGAAHARADKESET
jgi:tRNA pseudouridine38-40 synthase